MEKNEKKITYKKKMSLRDYANLANYLETGEFETDLSGCDSSALSEVKIYAMRLTKEQKKKVDTFFDRFILGTSAASIIDSIPKIKKPIAPVMVQQVVQQAQTQQVAAPTPAKSDESEGDKPAGVYPVMSDEERWDYAERLDKIAECNPKKTEITNYPFIKNWNEPITSVENIDFALMLKMVEDAKIDPTEVPIVLGQKVNSRFGQMHPTNFPDCPERYKLLDNTLVCLMEAQGIGERRRAILAEEYPPEDKILREYFSYITYKMKLIRPDEYERVKTYMDMIENISGDTVYLKTNDEDFEEKETIKYDDAETMKHDIIILADKFKFGFEIPIDVFGKKTTIKKLTKEIYKQYPNAEDGKFFCCRREELEKGFLIL